MNDVAATPAPTGPKAEAIRAFAAAGFTLIPVKGKTPLVAGWQDTKPGDYTPEYLAAVGGNYGVALGEADLVVDVDPRNFPAGDNVLRRFIAAAGPLISFTACTSTSRSRPGCASATPSKISPELSSSLWAAKS